MKKKILFMLCLAGSAKAEPRTLLYAGAQMGLNSAQIQVTNIPYAETQPQTLRNVIYKTQLGGQSIAGGLHAGIGYTFQGKGLLGLEIRYNGCSSAMQNDAGVGEDMRYYERFRLASTSDISIIGGGYIAPLCLVYVRAGLSNARISALMWGDFGDGAKKKNCGGFVGGFGMKYMLGASSYIGLDYSVNNGKSFKTDVFATPEIKNFNVAPSLRLSQLLLVTVGFKVNCF